MNLTIHPGNPLSGQIHLPGDKSLSHRAALFSVLAEGESIIRNFLLAGVTLPLIQALKSLGSTLNIEGDTLRVSGAGIQGLIPPSDPVDCGNSGTTLRLLAGALASAGLSATLDGSPGLRRRPMGRIVHPLQKMGVPISATPEGTAPLHLQTRPVGSRLKGIDYTLPVASAQVKTCLLLAALSGDRPTTLYEPGPSRDHTERLLRSMGARIEIARDLLPGNPASVSVTLFPPKASLMPLDITLPGDFSSAAFIIVAALINPGSQVTLRGVGLNPTRTGLLEALQEMGADIQVQETILQANEPIGDIHVASSELHATNVSGDRVVRMIDEFPVFAVAAACAKGITKVRDAAELRLKESDRISALCQEMRRIGVRAEETLDGFTIAGGMPLTGGVVTSHGDHRLAMALAICGLATREPVTVWEAQVISESFPLFYEILKQLGAQLTLDAGPEEVA